MDTTHTTQVCKKCKTEKPLTEYHRRGSSYQRICKTCRKAHVPSGNKRVIFLNQKENYPALAERIQKLDARLKAKAFSYANDPLEADDIYGAMVDEILFKSSPEDSDSRILTRATWAAKAIVRRNKAYAMHVGDEGEMVTDAGDGRDVFSETEKQFSVSPYKSAEDDYLDKELSEKIEHILAQLEPKYRQIVSLIAVGHTQREIAIQLGISDQTISTTIKRIAASLSSLGLSPA